MEPNLDNTSPTEQSGANGDLAQPIQPAQPMQSVPPVQPELVQPVQTQPTQPVQSAQPPQPVQPVSSAQPMQLAQPAQPAQSGGKSKTALIVGVVLGICLLGALAAAFMPWSELTETMQANNSGTDSSTSNTSGTFIGNGFDLSIISPWSESSIYEDDGSSTDVLVYDGNNYLMPIGVSALSEAVPSFDTDSDRKVLYNAFWDGWSSEYELYNGQDFKNLKDDIYYARMDYKINGLERGSLFVLASESNNVIFSFMTNTRSNIDEVAKKAIEVLKTIKITVKYDDEMVDYLDDMSAWNMYSSVRSGSLGHNKDIDGGWKVLSSGHAYWVFKDGQYWWYESSEDLTDNYWYGTFRRTTLDEVGISDENVERLIKNSSGKVTKDDLYALVLTPSKVIVDGEDKSSTNISGGDWHYVWILIDHGSEGIEAQILNTKNYDTSYYVKTSD